MEALISLAAIAVFIALVLVVGGLVRVLQGKPFCETEAERREAEAEWRDELDAHGTINGRIPGDW